ncbi:hypothetical protein CR513_40937, partial [Mucuna pruriens]
MFELFSRATTIAASMATQGTWYTIPDMPHLPIPVALHLSTLRTLLLGSHMVGIQAMRNTNKLKSMSRLVQIMLEPNQIKDPEPFSTWHPKPDQLRHSELAHMHSKPEPSLWLTRVGKPDLVIQQVAPQTEEKWHLLEELLRVVKGTDCYLLDAMDLCLVPDVGLLTNFKTPKFDKYKGSSCLRVHLAMGHIKTWRDMVEAFIKQYKYNEDMAPDHSQLQNMLKKE